MTPAGHKDDLDTGRMRPLERGEVGLRNVEFGIKQRAVDIGRQQPNGGVGKLHYSNFNIVPLPDTYPPKPSA